MKVKFLLLAAAATASMSMAAAVDFSAPDIEINEGNVGKSIEVPLTLTMPEGGDFTNIEIHLWYPEGLTPAQDEYGDYCFVGGDVAKNPRTGAAYVAFSDNCDVPEFWPHFTYVGANITKTETKTNPCEVLLINVKTIADNMDDLPDGEQPFKAYVKYTQYDDQSFTFGERASEDDFTPYQFCTVKYPVKGTGVADINATKAVSSVKYYNAAGVASDTAFDGVNIVVTKYADGSQNVVKVVK